MGLTLMRRMRKSILDGEFPKFVNRFLKEMYPEASQFASSRCMGSEIVDVRGQLNHQKSDAPKEKEIIDGSHMVGKGPKQIPNWVLEALNAAGLIVGDA